jgi:cyclophilin family peptidyl-prolyl cis-trans isomerase
LGDIEVELFDEDKPVTVRNFLHYVESGMYRDMMIHRWEPGFVIQGGGYFTTNRHTTNALIARIQPLPDIVNEYSIGRTFSNVYGTLAMARVDGQTNSANSQWFFNLTNNAFLDTRFGGFTVFGRVLRGTNVLERFNLTSTNNGIFGVNLGSPLHAVPVLEMVNPGPENLVYVDISLLKVRVAMTARGQPQISWQSVSNKVNRVEFTTRMPPTWSELTTMNGTGQILSVVDPAPGASNRFYRVRVDY